MTPATIQSKADITGNNLVAVRPFNCGLGDAIDSQQPVGNPVALLFRSGAPSKIARLIPLVVIYSVESVLRRGGSANIRQEFFKRRKCKDNAAPAISWIILVFRVIASLFSGTVSGVFFAQSRVKGFAVRAYLQALSFGSTRFARQCLPAFQAGCIYSLLGAAVASTQITTSVFMNTQIGEDEPATKSFVNKTIHKEIIAHSRSQFTSKTQ